MPLPPDYLEAIVNARNPSWGPLVIPWPMPGNLGGVVTFATFPEWREFVFGFGLRPAAPEVVAAKFTRAQKLYILAWLDPDLIKAGELVAMTALELAVTARYATEETTRRIKNAVDNAKSENRAISNKEKRWTENISFADLLKFMIERDGLTEETLLPINRRCGLPSHVIGRLAGQVKPSLAGVRNDLAHGAPLDGFPWSGLLELVRDLIDYAYRDWPTHENFVPISLCDVNDLYKEHDS